MLLLAALGLGIQAVSEIKKGDAQAEASKKDAEQTAINAQISREQAAEDERVFRMETRRALGSIRAGYAASGVDLSSGTPMDVLRDSAAQAELDALKIRHSGEIKALGYQTESQLAKARAGAYQAGGYLSAAGYLLGGLSKLSI